MVATNLEHRVARLERRGARAVPRLWWPAFGSLLLIFAAATYTRADVDLWGHLRYGLDIVETGGLTSNDPYSFTQDTPWVNHEWLSEVQTAVAYQLGGVAGLALLKGSLVFVAFWLMWIAMDGARLGARVVVMAFVAFGTVHITSSVRPQVWTFLALGLLCHALVARRPGPLWWLPALFVVWVNVHGGWVVGLGVLGVWAAAEVLADRSAFRTWGWVVSLCLLATLVNPYGWGIWDFILRTVRPDREIAEWLPVWEAGWAMWVPWVVAASACLWAAPKLPEARWPTIAVIVMLAWSSLRVMRIGSLFIEAAVILLAPVVVANWPARLAALPVRRPRGEGLIAVYLLALCATAAGWGGSQTLRCLAVGGRGAPDVTPIHLLRGQPPGRLVTFFDWGQYALWHVGPDIKVSMDGRRETVYSEARLDEHDAIVLGTADGFETLERWKAEYVWLPASSAATRDWLAANGYRLDYESDLSFLAVRRDLAPLPEAAANPPVSACFPG